MVFGGEVEPGERNEGVREGVSFRKQPLHGLASARVETSVQVVEVRHQVSAGGRA
jgi:hypothetical protein